MTLTAYYADEHIALYHGQALDRLLQMPDGSVDCCVTSPPYFGLRDYKVDGQLGLEASPDEYVEKLRVILHQVHRVLADDGTLWLNLGDSYAGKANGGPTRDRHRGHGHRGGVVANQRNLLAFAPYKSLLGIPWRVAFALQGDGWAIRNDIVWHKPNAMPESVADRFKSAHETLFLITKSPRYWFDQAAVAEPAQGRAAGGQAGTARSYGEQIGGQWGQRGHRFGGNPGSTLNSVVHETRNPGDVWSIPTKPFPDAHFATMPPALAERCVLAGCRPGGTVLDPFSGVGTTGMVATKHGRRYIGIELSAATIDLSLRTRLAQAVFSAPGAAR